MLEELQVYHQKGTPYHPKANGIVEVFDKVLENALTQVYNMKRNDWDICIPIVVCPYKMTCKKLIEQTPFSLVYGIELVMPMKYNFTSLCIVAFTKMTDRETLEE